MSVILTCNNVISLTIKQLSWQWIDHNHLYLIHYSVNRLYVIFPYTSPTHSSFTVKREIKPVLCHSWPRCTSSIHHTPPACPCLFQLELVQTSRRLPHFSCPRQTSLPPPPVCTAEPHYSIQYTCPVIVVIPRSSMMFSIADVWACHSKWLHSI